MSAVIVLTPLVISSWPAIYAAVMGAATGMGFALQGSSLHEEQQTNRTKVETEIEDSEVVADSMTPTEKIVVQRAGVTIEVGQDERGRCTVCVSGEGQSKKRLKQIGDEVAGRIVQQFAYHKLVTELKNRNYSVVDEEVLADQSVRLRVRL
jgi:hypothetical protein